MIFYKRYLGAYRKKTSRLTPIQHGVYNLLLDEIYATEEPLPLDQDELHEIAHARTAADRAAVQKVLERYFVSTEAGWVNERALEEIAAFADKSDKARTSAAMRWDSKRTCERISERISERDAIQSQSHKVRREERGEGATAPSRGMRLAQSWSPCTEAIAFALDQGLTHDEITRTADRFRDHWIAQPGQRGVKSDWLATWRNWIRRDASEPSAQAPRTNARRSQREIKQDFARAAKELIDDPSDAPSAGMHPSAPAIEQGSGDD